MNNLQECLKYFIGLSQKDCNCHTTDRPTDYNRSDSGYFIDDIATGVNLKWVAGANDCGDNGIWSMLERSRNLGIQKFIEDFSKAVNENTQKRVPNLNAEIGMQNESAYLMHLDNSKGFVGVEIRPRVLKGGTFYLREVSLCVNTAQDLTVEIYCSNNFTTPVFTQLVSGTAHARRTVMVNQSLPFTDLYGNALRYFVVYERAATLPKDNKFICCENTTPYNTYIEVGGFQAASLTDLATTKGIEPYTMSLILRGLFKCDGFDFLCSSDPTDVEYGQILAHTLQLCAANALFTALWQSNKINFYTLMDGEVMNKQRYINDSKIKSNIRWLAQNIPAELSECYLCGGSNTVAKQSVLI